MSQHSSRASVDRRQMSAGTRQSNPVVLRSSSIEPWHGLCRQNKAGGFEGSVLKPAPPSDHTPLGRRCAFGCIRTTRGEAVRPIPLLCCEAWRYPASDRRHPIGRAGAVVSKWLEEVVASSSFLWVTVTRRLTRATESSFPT